MIEYRSSFSFLTLDLVLQGLSLFVEIVFWTFLYRILKYWLEIWYMNLLKHNTDQVWVSSRLTFCHGSYCNSQNFVFLTFSAVFWNIEIMSPTYPTNFQETIHLQKRSKKPKVELELYYVDTNLSKTIDFCYDLLLMICWIRKICTLKWCILIELLTK